MKHLQCMQQDEIPLELLTSTILLSP